MHFADKFMKLNSLFIPYRVLQYIQYSVECDLCTIDPHRFILALLPFPSSEVSLVSLI